MRMSWMIWGMIRTRVVLLRRRSRYERIRMGLVLFVRSFIQLAFVQQPSYGMSAPHFSSKLSGLVAQLTNAANPDILMPGNFPESKSNDPNLISIHYLYLWYLCLFDCNTREMYYYTISCMEIGVDGYSTDIFLFRILLISECLTARASRISMLRVLSETILLYVLRFINFSIRAKTGEDI
jgi:hypothetical protein